MTRFRRAKTREGYESLVFTDGPQSALIRLALLLPGAALSLASVMAMAWLAGEQLEPAWAALMLLAWLALTAILGVMLMQRGIAPAKRLRIDQRTRRVQLWQKPMFGAARLREIALEDLAPPRVYTEPSAPDFPDQPLMEIVLSENDWIRIESFHTEEEAKACAARIAALADGPRHGPQAA